MDKHLRIILELVTTGFGSGARTAQSIFKNFTGSILNGALSASRALLNLAQTVFFVREALSTLAQVGRWVFDTFVKGAGDAAKLEAKLKNVTGSAEDAERVMGLLRQTAADTGANFDELAAGAGLMAVAAKDASGAFDFNKFQRLMNLLQRAAALRPDVPLDRLARGIANAAKGDWQSLEMFLDVQLRQLLGIKDAADEVTDVPDKLSKRVMEIETGVGDAAKDALADLDMLDEALSKAGATADIVGDIAEKSGLERFQQILKQIADTVGEPIFEVLNTELSKLADWLQDNPDKVQGLATALGEGVANALERLFDVLEKINWDQVAEDFDKLVTAISEGDWKTFAETLQTIGGAVQTVADAINAVKSATNWAQQANIDVNQAGQNVGNVLGTSQIGPGIQQGDPLPLLRALLQGANPVGAGMQAAQRVIVELDLKSDLLEGKIRQTSGDVVTEFANTMTEELEEGRR